MALTGAITGSRSHNLQSLEHSRNNNRAGAEGKMPQLLSPCGIERENKNNPPRAFSARGGLRCCMPVSHRRVRRY